VNEVWPLAELRDRAVALAEELAAMPRVAVRAMLGCLVGSESKSLADSLRNERAAVHATIGSPDAAEGMRAFLEKRRPVFNRN
jgi:enoyl-CoA hydratase